jgi:hypothetical protein
MRETAQWLLLGVVLGGLIAATVFNVVELLDARRLCRANGHFTPSRVLACTHLGH